MMEVRCNRQSRGGEKGGAGNGENGVRSKEAGQKKGEKYKK